MSSFSIGQMNQLAAALGAAGFTPEHVTRLGQCGRLQEIRNVLDGFGEVCMNEHVIDCDIHPFVPYQDSKWVHHRKGGQFLWDKKKIKLYWYGQQASGAIYYSKDDLLPLFGGDRATYPVLNANVLDYLLDHPQLIPEEWKYSERGDWMNIHFWGTRYESSNRRPYIRSLCFEGGHWHGGVKYLVGESWKSYEPAILYKS